MDYLRTIGVSYQDMLERGYDIVIVDASLQFLAPAHFDEILEIYARMKKRYARISKIGNSSIKMDYEIYEAASERFVAKAQTAYVIIEKMDCESASPRASLYSPRSEGIRIKRRF